MAKRPAAALSARECVVLPPAARAMMARRRKQSSPNEQDAQDEAAMIRDDFTTYYNPTDLTSRVDPAGFDNIMPQTVIKPASSAG